MLKHTIRRTTLAVTGQLSRLVRTLLNDEASSGKFLLAAVAVAILFTNSPWHSEYDHFWTQHLSISFGGFTLSDTLQHWINEGLMAIFFLVVGLEIKRELARGELRTLRAASLPILAAVGGMLIPALIYMTINAGHAGFPGWGIPMTTDIAFAIGVLALLGRRIPAALRLFLLTLAVVDDIGAIIVIAVFYAQAIHWVPFFIAAGVLGCIGLLQWLKLLRLSIFVTLGLVLWFALYKSGVHAAIAGALLGLSAPIVSRRKDKQAIAGRLERALIPVSAFVVVPLFALANAGVVFSRAPFQDHTSILVGAGIVAGLVLGKVAGITGTAWLVMRLSPARLPKGITWPQLAGAAMLAGIGFTLSIFIAQVAFAPGPLEEAAKIGTFAASLISGVAGFLWLRRATTVKAIDDTDK